MIVKLIQIIHLVICLGVIFSIFIPNLQFKKLALTFVIFLFYQYFTNWGKCGLTELEYVLKGENYKDGFIYRVVKPVITIPENYFNSYLYMAHIIWTLILAYQIKYY